MKPLNTLNTRKDLLFQKESYAIRGAVFEVYREMRKYKPQNSRKDYRNFLFLCIPCVPWLKTRSPVKVPTEKK
jgi:hypothetical protein